MISNISRGSARKIFFPTRIECEPVEPVREQSPQKNFYTITTVKVVNLSHLNTARVSFFLSFFSYIPVSRIEQYRVPDVTKVKFEKVLSSQSVGRLSPLLLRYNPF